MNLARLALITISAAGLMGATAPQGVQQSDQQLLNKLAKGNSAEVQMGKLAEQKATHPAVQAFGKRMVEDHSVLLKQTQSFGSEHGVKLQPTPNDEQKMMHNKLSKMSGKEFDQGYMNGMLEDHRKDVSEVAKYIAEHPESPVRPMLLKVLPILENHMRIAENVAGQIGVAPDAGLVKPEHPES